MRRSFRFLLLLLPPLIAWPVSALLADEKADKKPEPSTSVSQETDSPKPLNKAGTVLLDVKGKKLLLKSCGRACLKCLFV